MRKTCVKCGGAYTHEEAKATRLVPFMESVEETGIQCPHCGNWMHAFFMTGELCELKVRVDELKKAWRQEGSKENEWRYTALKNRFVTTFKAVNQELRSLIGAEAPHEFLVERHRSDHVSDEC